jgi:hypothetical protein
MGIAAAPHMPPNQPPAAKIPPAPVVRRHRTIPPSMGALIALLLVVGTTLAVLGASHPQLFAIQQATRTVTARPSPTALPSPTPTTQRLTAAQIQAVRTVVQRFCNDIQWQNYGDAYSLLASSLQRNVTKDKFVADEYVMDTSPGRLVACTLVQDTSENAFVGNVVIYLLQPTLRMSACRRCYIICTRPELMGDGAFRAPTQHGRQALLVLSRKPALPG